MPKAYEFYSVCKQTCHVWSSILVSDIYQLHVRVYTCSWHVYLVTSVVCSYIMVVPSWSSSSPFPVCRSQTTLYVLYVVMCIFIYMYMYVYALFMCIIIGCTVHVRFTYVCTCVCRNYTYTHVHVCTCSKKMMYQF